MLETLNGKDEGLEYRRRYRGLIGVHSKVPVRDRAILSLIYTPGVAEACLDISKDPLASYDLTCRDNTVGILTDGSDLFGREGGPAESAIPIAEGKSVIFKTFAGVDAFPICIDSNDPGEIIQTGMAVTPTFGALCIDDISTPRAFTILDHLEKAIDIPVFSNQHHGTAILVLGGLLNALKVVNKRLEESTVVISGAGVAGIGVARLLTRAGVKRLVVCDRAGAIYRYRPERMNWAKAYVAKETNHEQRRGSLAEMLEEQGHSVTQAPGGREGLSYLESNPELVDVVISDLGMPDMTGWDVTRTIQSRWPRLPVGLITGWGETEITREERGRVNFVITKPFDKALLSQTMSDIRPRA